MAPSFFANGSTTSGMVGYLKLKRTTTGWWTTSRTAKSRSGASTEKPPRGGMSYWRQRRGGETQAEKDVAAAEALATSQECHTFSTRRAKRAFKKWKKKHAKAPGGEEKDGVEEKEAELLHVRAELLLCCCCPAAAPFLCPAVFDRLFLCW